MQLCHNPTGESKYPPSIVTQPTVDTMGMVGGSGLVRRVERRVQDLLPHPSFAKLCPSQCQGVSARRPKPGKLSDEPLSITHQNYIIDGYARWHHARATGRESLQCNEHQLSECESLLLLLQGQSKRLRLNQFNRIRLTLELEPWLKEQSRANQQRGGRFKGSSNLTEADKVDVRAKVAEIAESSVGNVTKVKRLLKTADLCLIDKLQCGEISIHKAWQWSQLAPQAQVLRIEQLEKEAGIRPLIARLIGRHRRDAKLTDALKNIAVGLSVLRQHPHLQSLQCSIGDLLSELAAVQVESSPGL